MEKFLNDLMRAREIKIERRMSSKMSSLKSTSLFSKILSKELALLARSRVKNSALYFL